MYCDNRILVGKSEGENVYFYPSMANRHGLIAGATGTGKTISLKVLAESFSDAGVPVFLADVKGDLAGTAVMGEPNANVDSRAEKMGLKESGFDYRKYPVNFWDVYGEKGMPLRTTVSEMGPMLMAAALGLNDVQTDILTVIYKIADDESLLLIDTKDLKAMIQYVSEKRDEYAMKYGNMAPQSLAAIIRAVVALEAEGGELFFGEPAVSISDWLATNADGKGIIEILDCQKLFLHPRMYAAFLMWLMSELFETLPEVGDLEKPKLVFFFDEAHLLFDSASKALLDRIEQVVKLIRSKGVGIYFVTQAPTDIPDGVLAQLGNKIQHALRAYTPAEQKKMKAAAMSYRANPAFDTYKVLDELGTGEALVSVIDEEGVPTVVCKTKILPPQSKMGSIDDALRDTLVKSGLLYTKYLESTDRDSMYEFMQRRSIEIAEAAEKERAQKEEAKAQEAEEKAAAKKAREAEKVKSNAAKSVSGTIGRELGKTIGGSLGGNFGKKIGGNLGASLGRGIIGTLFRK